MADLAAGHAARGWHVFPVLPDSKQPAIVRWTELASADPKKVRAAWPANHNIGVSCGPSQLVVIDLDVATGKPLPPPWDTEPGVTNGLDVWAVLRERHDPDWSVWLSTYTVATARGGLHLYFRNPETATATGQWRNTSSTLAPMVDTRAAGGYVVGAGSTVDGKSYDLLDDAAPARAPGWLAILLTQAASRPAAAPTAPATLRQPDRYIETAFKNEIAAVAGRVGAVCRVR